jgi:two-component system chemotaxis response regulator CheB
MTEDRIVVIGTSAGGVAVLYELLKTLPKEFSLPLVVIQHLPDTSRIDVTRVYPSSAHDLIEIEDKMPVESGRVYFAPGGYHVLFEKDQTFSLTQDEPVRFSRPSIDVCFESAIQVFGDKVIALVLTGANDDGAEGLAAVKHAGGVTAVQDPETAEFSEMPKAALNMGKPDFILNARELPQFLLNQQREASL